MSESENLQPEAAGEAEAAPDYPLPPANFEFLVLRLTTEAQMFLGLLHFGEKEAAEKPNLRAAQHCIDLLGVLLEKTRGNLTMEETRLVENSLTELRFRYVQAADAGRKDA